MVTRILGFAALLLIVEGYSVAGPTGLNAMPTADVLGHKELYVSYGFAGTERNISRDTTHAAGALVGISGRIECGYDHDLRGAGSGNIKLALFSNKKAALSAGLMSIGQGQTQKYVVAALTLSENSRLHAGWLDDGSDRWIAGFDMAVGESGTLMIDTISGSDSYSYIGFNYVLPKLNSLDITVSAGIPHERANGYTYSLTFGYGLRL